MLPEGLPFDAKRGVTAFSLEGYVEIVETILDIFSYESKITKTWRGIEGDVWNKYLNRDKMLIFMSVGISEFISGTMLIDAADYLGITPEGQGKQGEDEWVTIWIDGGLGVDFGLIPTPVVFGVKSYTFDEPATADVRQSITEEIGSLSILGRRFTFLTVENGKPQFFESNRNFETQISLSVISGAVEDFLRYEISRSRLNQIFSTVLLSKNGNIALETELSPIIQLYSDIKTIIDEGINGLDFRIPGTDDDGNWKPDTPTNVIPSDGATGVSVEPVRGSLFSDFDCNLPTCIPDASHWQVDDNEDFSSPTYDSDQQIGISAELPTGRLEYNTLYFWRVQYKDSDNAWSDWSFPTSFRTLLQGEGTLSLSPPENFNASGEAGGPFIPSSKEYILTNKGDAPISWEVYKLEDWITISKISGTLLAGQTDTIDVIVNSNANNLPLGSYTDTVIFENLTNGNGSTSQTVNLSIISVDNCPDDPNKTDPGICGCGIPDTDSDGDGTPDCLKPIAPSYLSASDGTYIDKISLTWIDKSYNEDGFRVYRSTSQNGAYTKIAETNSTFYDDFLSCGTTYWYKVTAYNDGEESEDSNKDSGYYDCTDTYSLNLSINGGGTVISNPPGIDCQPDCTEDYPKDTPVALTANPDTANGWTFDRWSNCDSPSGNTCDITMDSNKNVTAVFIGSNGISGQVTLLGGAANVTDVLLTLSEAVSQTTNPDAGDNYIFIGLGVGDYTVTPSLTITPTEYYFFPASFSYLPLNSSRTDQDFTVLHESYDSDSDSLPDWWEYNNFGIGDLTQGANDNPDNDEWSNLEEYNNSFDPNNASPDRPGVVSPADQAVDVSLTTDLTGSVYSDMEGDIHAAANRQIADLPFNDPNFSGQPELVW